jgi:RNA polymerase sigma-70 factor (ECF subfamily)
MTGRDFVTADADAGRTRHLACARADEVGGLFDRALVSEAVKQLSASHRRVIHQAHQLGWTTGQIAADLNVTPAVAKSLLHHALRTLRLTLLEMSQPPGQPQRGRRTAEPVGDSQSSRPGGGH